MLFTVSDVHVFALILAALMAMFMAAKWKMLPFGMTFFNEDDAIKYLISIGFLDAAGGLKLGIATKTADYTIVTGTDKSGTMFTNRGDDGAIVFTLPAPSQAIKGTFYDFVGVANQSITVETPTADTLVAFNDAAADSIALSTTNEMIGGAMRFVCDGDAWIGFGISVGHTFTVAT